MRIFNYTTAVKRDRKIYVKLFVTDHVRYSFLKIGLPIMIGFTILGYFLSSFFNIDMFNPLSDGFNLYYTAFFIGGGLGIGISFYSVKIGGYRIYEYLNAYFKPKKAISNQNKRDGKIIDTERKLMNYKIRSVVKNDV